jgi:hypothetical protein
MAARFVFFKIIKQIKIKKLAYISGATGIPITLYRQHSGLRICQLTDE